MTDIIKVVAVFAPIYFYFLPYSLVTIFYERFIDDNFNPIIGDVEDGYYRRKVIKDNMTNMITFLSFVSVFIGSFISIIYTLSEKPVLFKSHIGFCMIVYFCLGMFLIIQNLSKKLYLSRIELALQHLFVVSTSIFIYFNL